MRVGGLGWSLAGGGEGVAEGCALGSLVSGCMGEESIAQEKGPVMEKEPVMKNETVKESVLEQLNPRTVAAVVDATICSC